MRHVHRWRDPHKTPERENAGRERRRPLTPWCLPRDAWPGHTYYYGSTCGFLAGANRHTNNTAELSGIVESLHFFSMLKPFPRGSQACFSHDSRHVVNACLGSASEGEMVQIRSATCRVAWPRSASEGLVAEPCVRGVGGP